MGTRMARRRSTGRALKVLVGLACVGALLLVLRPEVVRACLPVTVSLSGGGPIPVCGEALFSAVGDPNGGSYSWSCSGGSIEVDPDHPDAATFFAGDGSGENVGQVSVTYTCGDDSDTDGVAFDIVGIGSIIPSSAAVAVGSSYTFNATTNPQGPGYANWIQWSLVDTGQVGSGAAFAVAAPQQPGTYTVIAKVGDDRVDPEDPSIILCECPKAEASLKVVDLLDLTVSGGGIDPESLVACWAEDGYVEICATLSGGCSDDEIRSLLVWDYPSHVVYDPENPECVKVPLNVACKTTVTATVGSSSFTAEVLVIKLNSITVSDQHHHGLSRTNPPDDTELYIPKGALGWGFAHLDYSVSPELGKGYLVARVTGDTANPSEGSLAGYTPPLAVVLIPSQGNRSYTFQVGVDTTGAGNPDNMGCDPIQSCVHVVKTDLDVDSNNNGSIDTEDDAIELSPGTPERPGKVLPVNALDDPNNLAECKLDLVGDPGGGTWSLSWSPSDHLAVYRDRDKTESVVAGQTYPRSELPLPLYVEGLAVSDAAGDTTMTLVYRPPDYAGDAFQDSVRLTVGKAEITEVILPNGFLGTLDEDVDRADWEIGIRQSAENTIGVKYRLRPEMAFSTDTSKVTLNYHGPQWLGVGSRPTVDTELASDEDLAGAPGDDEAVDYPNLPIGEDFDGISSTESGGAYRLIVETTNDTTGVRFVSDPYGVEAKPLVYGFN